MAKHVGVHAYAKPVNAGGLDHAASHHGSVLLLLLK